MNSAPVRPQPRLILPPGWVLLPVSGDNAATAQETLAELRALGPRDSVGPFAAQLERALTAALDEAAGAGAFAVVMPLGLPWRVPVSTSIALSVLVPESGAPSLPTVGAAVDTDAGEARRRIIDLPVDDEADPERIALLRTVDYTWVHRNAYLLAFASISGLPVDEYAPVTEAMTLLLTTMLDALTFTFSEDES